MAVVGGSGKGIQIVVGADYNDRDLKRAQRDLDRLSAQARKTQGPMAQLGAGIRKQLTPNLMLAGAAAAAFAVKLGVDAVKAAAAEEQAIARLSTALENADQGMALEGVERFIDSMARGTGIADDQLRPAMITLVNATKDAADAQGLLSLALDISAGSGRDLNSVTMALAKAANGQVTALRRLGVPLSDAAIKSKDLAAITGELQQTFGGQAAKAADTFQGRLNRLSVALGELQESLGTGFINGLEGGAQGTDDLSDSIRDLEPLVEALGNQVGSAVKGFGDLVFLAGEGAKQMGLFEGSTEEASSGVEQFANDLFNLAFANGGALGAVSDLRDYLEDQGIITKTAAETHATYRDAVVRAGDAARKSKTAISDMGVEVDESGEAAEDAAKKYDLFAAAVARVDAVVAFRQAVDAVGEAFKKSNTPVNIFNKQGKANFDLLQDLIKDTAAYSEGQTTLTGKLSTAAQGLNSLESALGNAKMDPQTAAMLLQPFQALIADLDEAGVDVSGLQQQLDRLKSKTIEVTVKTTTVGGRPPGVSAEEWYGVATGGSMRRFAVGTHLSDSIPAMLSRGEYVIRAEAVRRVGTGFLDSVNQGRRPTGNGTGVMIENLNVTAAPGERAEESVPRALRRYAFVAGLNG